MKVVTGARQTGKTTEAIELANEEDAYLVVHTKDRATQVYHGENYPDLDRFPITYQELRGSLRGAATVNESQSDSELRNGHSGRPHRVVIDDLDMFLRSQFDVPVEAVTMTAAETTALGTQQ